jgi:hypothetical protein
MSDIVAQFPLTRFYRDLALLWHFVHMLRHRHMLVSSQFTRDGPVAPCSFVFSRDYSLSASSCYLLRGQDPSANTNSPAPIATERPTVTNSSIVVPLGYLQAENGFLDTYSHGVNTADGPETLLRLGIASKTERRLTVPDYFYNVTSGGGPATGFGDMAVGVKQQIGPRPAASMFPRRCSSASRQERGTCPAAGTIPGCRSPGRTGSPPNGQPQECSRCTGPRKVNRAM